MSTAVPLTPKKSKEENVNLKIAAVVSSLSHEWDLQLELPRSGDSPSNRQNQTLGQKCVFTIKGLTFKGSIDSVLKDFYSQANILYSGWVHKPKGERGMVPEKTRHKPHPVSDKERVELQNLFYGLASREFNEIMIQERGTPLSKRRVLRSHDKGIEAERSGSPLPLDDTPIPSKLLSSTRKPSLKRAAEATHDEVKIFKRPLKPDSKPELDSASRASFSITATSERTRKVSHDASAIMSVNTSFSSYAPSVFDTSFGRSRGLSDVFSTTQATEPDDQSSDVQTSKLPVGRSMKLSIIDDHHSSEYEGGSSFDAQVAELVKVADSFHSVSNELESGSVRTDADDDVFEDAVDNMLNDDEAKVRAREQNLRESLKDVFRAYF